MRLATERLELAGRSYFSNSTRLARGIRPIKKELQELFTPFSFNFEPSIIDANAKIKADYAFSSSMEIFRSGNTGLKSSQEVAQQIAQEAQKASAGKINVKVANFYVNITLSDSFIDECISKFLKNATVAPPHIDGNRRVVIDYSSPNIAKQMHVGHLRSTIIGNSLANLYEYVGHETIRINHLGDWGTQFGTLLQHFIDLWGNEITEKVSKLSLSDVTKLYRDAKRKFEFDEDESFAHRARICTARLQSGEDATLTQLWRYLIQISLKDFNHIYNRLGVARDASWYVGESFYQDKVDIALRDLEGHLKTSPDDNSVLLYTGIAHAKIASQDPAKPDDEVPLILRKSDGSIGYDATDVAAIRYRLVELDADEVVYVTDSGQALHFHLVFQAAKLAGWAKLDSSLTHVSFGVVTKSGGGGRIRTREGESQTLDSLLDKAAERILLILQSKRASWSEAEKAVLTSLAENAGTFCVIVSELKTNRSSDYQFDLDRMCNPDGNSGLFILHVLRKIKRVANKSGFQANKANCYSHKGACPAERALAVEIIKFHDVVQQSLETHNPQVMTMHLLSIATKTSSFIANQMTGPSRIDERLALLNAAENAILQYLKLLGLAPTLERMQPELTEMSTWKNSDDIL